MIGTSPLATSDCIVFDMDGTLAVSKGPITPGMATVLNQLLSVKKVAVISGGSWEQFEKQFISFLSKEHMDNLIILPTSGAAMYLYEHGVWQKKYSEVIPLAERVRVIEELKSALKRVGYHEEETYGKIIEDRFSQITFSGLGQEAPFEKKSLWDPDQKKRQMIASVLRSNIPEYTVTLGGASSIDITPGGFDKAYGVERLSKTLSIPLEKIVFVGDKLDPGGNDYPVTRLGIRTIAVRNEHETEKMLESWFI